MDIRGRLEWSSLETFVEYYQLSPHWCSIGSRHWETLGQDSRWASHLPGKKHSIVAMPQWLLHFDQALPGRRSLPPKIHLISLMSVLSWLMLPSSNHLPLLEKLWVIFGFATNSIFATVLLHYTSYLICLDHLEHPVRHALALEFCRPKTVLLFWQLCVIESRNQACYQNSCRLEDLGLRWITHRPLGS